MAVSPFHEGEQRIQRRLGVRDEIEPWARRVVRPYLPDEHRDFYAALPWLVVAGRDTAERPWATVLAGAPGFAGSPDPKRLRVDALPAPGDALDRALRPGRDVGFLGIELQTRRRNRVNGIVRECDAQGFDVEVGQSFGNCPQHITERTPRRVRAHAPRAACVSPSLTADQRHWIRSADTFFIATGHRADGENVAFGMDASHRGGPAGFVDVANPHTLSFPDYAGNNHFNTLGNLELDPRAGITFVQFTTGSLLQLTGRAFVEWGGERRIRFEIERVVEQPGVLPFRWERENAQDRVYRVAARRTESADAVSFFLTPDDEGAAASFEAGQHLPIRLALEGNRVPLTRTYSLSGDPAADHLRITVKREDQGAVSRHLHDRVAVGDRILAGNPAGDFILPETNTGPVVLVSAGIGVTPMVAMAHALAERPEVAVRFIHGARDGEHDPLRTEIDALARRARNVETHTRYSWPLPGDRLGREFDSVGRIDVELIEKLVPGLAGDFLLCGPVAFLDQLATGLEGAGVSPGRIHFESFGASGA